MARGRTLGSVLFQRAPGTQREKARMCHVAESTASRWCSGDKVPSAYQQRILIERACGVAPELWDKPYSALALAELLKNQGTRNLPAGKLPAGK